MNLYLNLNSNRFLEDLKGAYIDKTQLLAFTNSVLLSKDKYVCVSRPRRFGKSITADMLVAYYSKGSSSKELFSKFKIAKDPSFNEHLNKYNTISLDIQYMISKCGNVASVIEYIQTQIIEELKEAFPNCITDDKNLVEAIAAVYKTYHEKFIFIIDEWDAIFRLYENDFTLQANYIDLLRGLFKGAGADDSVVLAYITGILPIKKYKTESALNNFDEFTMLNPMELASCLGFTKSEVLKICQEENISFNETCRWYDGYRLKDEEIFNPKSIMMLKRTHEFFNYWSKTGAFEAVSDYIKADFDGLKEAFVSLVNGNRLSGIDIDNFENSLASIDCRDAVFVYLIHLGYLAYDATLKQAYIPNEEVRQALLTVLKEKKWSEYIDQIKASTTLLEKTIFEHDCNFVAKTIEKFHQELTSIIKYNNENALSIIVNNAYCATAEYYYKPVREMPLGKGFADIVYLPKTEFKDEFPALVIELKWNKDADCAISQIKDKQYCNSLLEYTGNIVLVGISYDQKTKVHTCSIETLEK